MERNVALTKLRKLLGSKLGYRVDSRAPSREEREAAQAALPAIREKRDQIKALRDARYKELLEADVEYQRLRAEHGAARDAVDKLQSTTHHFKITVGISSSIFFHVKAEGDSWEEVIEKLQKRPAFEKKADALDAAL